MRTFCSPHSRPIQAPRGTETYSNQMVCRLGFMSEASFFTSGNTGLKVPNAEDRALMALKENFAVIDQLIDIPPRALHFELQTAD